MHPALSIFETLTTIPHGSHNEKQISDFLLSYAVQRGYTAVQDEHWNVVVYVPATPGYENSAPVILQGHMDMVCEKAPGCTHDFSKDALPLVYDGDILRTNGTTLGADDGVALAYCLALLDSDAPHPPLELLFTVEEEVGMKGARTFDPNLLKGRLLINLDSSGEGEITVGCAGGASVQYRATLPRTAATGTAYSLTLDGLAGGHSGTQIHLERANANKLLCRVLLNLLEQDGVQVASIHGGSKTNAIPLYAQAVLTTQADLAEAVQRWNAILQQEYHSSDPGVRLTLAPAVQAPAQVFSANELRKLLAAVSLTPCGPVHRDPALGVVLASSSMGILETQGDTIVVKNALRANLESLLDELVQRMLLVAQAFGLEAETGSRYPSWAYKSNSPLQAVAKDAYNELYGKDPAFLIIHAGLEVGYLAEKLPGLDAISIGPNVTGLHTIYEQMSVSSFIATYEYLLEILRRLQ